MSSLVLIYLKHCARDRCLRAAVENPSRVLKSACCRPGGIDLWLKWVSLYVTSVRLAVALVSVSAISVFSKRFRYR